MFVTETPDEIAYILSGNCSLRVQELDGMYHIINVEDNSKIYVSYDNKTEAEENLNDLQNALASGLKIGVLKARVT
ncbi:MAG: hypothetical protein OXI43_04825 [Candidatus Poribacteria bacterium]|nr:hypothetical protein [Candidatus Poribacteria bacterium]